MNSKRQQHLALSQQAAQLRRAASTFPLSGDTPFVPGVFIVRVISGSVTDGYSVKLVGPDDTVIGDTYTRVRTKPGGTELVTDTDYPAIMDELSRRPVVIAFDPIASDAQTAVITGYIRFFS